MHRKGGEITSTKAFIQFASKHADLLK